MAEKLPKAHYDRDSDSLYIVISKGPEEGFIELAPDINLELGRNGKVIGIEIRKASNVFNKEVEQGLRQSLQGGEVLTFLAQLGRRAGPTKRARPHLKGSPAEFDVREMRRRRFEGSC